MEFGICFKGDISPQRTVALVRQAEVAGFQYGWFFDSHILWRSPYVTMAMCMEHTEKMRFARLSPIPACARAESRQHVRHANVRRQTLRVGIGARQSMRGWPQANTVERMVDFTQP